MQTLKIKRIHPNVKLPQYAHNTDAGMDLYLPETLTLAPGERKKITSGIALELPSDTVGLILEKSSRAAEGLKGSGGVIDEGYRGEVYLMPWNTTDHELHYEAGTPYAQLVVIPIVRPEVIEAQELSESPRGAGGFGSTHTVKHGQWVSTVK